MRRNVRAIAADTGWQALFTLFVEVVALGVVLSASAAAFGDGVFAFAFLICYAVTTAATFRRRAKLNLSLLDDLPLLMLTVGAASGVGYWAVGRIPSSLTGWQVLGCALLALGGVVLARLTSYALVKTARRSLTGEPAVVVGAGRNADFLVERLGAHREYGLDVLGRFEVAAPSRDGGRADLDGLFAEFPSARTILVADSELPDSDLLPGLRAALARGARVYFVPRFAELGSRRLNAEAVWGMPLQSVAAPAGSWQRGLKRAFDIAVAGTALVFLAPLMLLVGFLISRETGGSVLFRQRRVGRYGREFDLLKFQTMVPATQAEGDTNWNIAQDDRVGPLGRLLRATSIDELPQLINILRGDMSVVGPRPERPHFVELFSAQYPHYASRHRVPVGLTGWAQIHRLRGDTSIDDRARFDNAYCDQWSVWSDIKIILKTVPEVVRHSGG